MLAVAAPDPNGFLTELKYQVAYVAPAPSSIIDSARAAAHLLRRDRLVGVGARPRDVDGETLGVERRDAAQHRRDVVARLVVARVVPRAGVAAEDPLLVRRLDALGAGEHAARGDARGR